MAKGAAGRKSFGPGVFACECLICSFARMGWKQQCFQYHCGEKRLDEGFEAVQTVMEKKRC
jgi:hypothetical protein